MNLYAYVGNDPINGRDPLGLFDCTADADDCAEIEASVDAGIADADAALGELNELNERFAAVDYKKSELDSNDQDLLDKLEERTGNKGDPLSAMLAAAEEIGNSKSALENFRDDDYAIAERGPCKSAADSACATVGGGRVTYTDRFFDDEDPYEQGRTSFHEGTHLYGYTHPQSYDITNIVYFDLL